MKFIITSKGDPECNIEPLHAEVTINQVNHPDELPEIRAILQKAFWNIVGEPVEVEVVVDGK